MSKVQKQPLSKIIGQWDNGYINTPKINYTMDQLERAFRACKKYKKLLNSDQLRIVLRGSPKKNSANADLVDIDVHAIFMGNININAEKNDVFNAMIAYFKFEDVQRKSKAITISPNKKRLKIDLIVCRQGDGEVVALNDNTKREESFFTPDEQSLIGKLDSSCNGNFSKMVRTFKHLRNLVCQATGKKYYITSHAIECMLFSIRKKIYRTKYDRNVEVDTKKRFLAVVQSVGAKLKNAKQYSEIKEINGQKQLFKDNQQYKVFVEFWNDLHDYLVSNYNFEK